jgi:hypothetical protein
LQNGLLKVGNTELLALKESIENQLSIPDDKKIEAAFFITEPSKSTMQASNKQRTVSLHERGKAMTRPS